MLSGSVGTSKEEEAERLIEAYLLKVDVGKIDASGFESKVSMVLLGGYEEQIEALVVGSALE